MRGAGVINGNVLVGGEGNVFPDGKLTINGFLSEGPNTFTGFHIGGLNQGTDYDFLEVNGDVGIGGLLFLTMSNGFELQLSANQIFTILTSNGVITGTFDNVANGTRLETTDGLASFQVNYGSGSLFDPDDLVLSDPKIVPEPGSVVLLAMGGGLIGVIRFRRRPVCR